MIRFSGLIALFIILTTSCSIDKRGEIRLIAGSGAPGFVDGYKAELNKPIRLAPYKEESIIFADINNHAIRIVDIDGKVTTIAGGPEKKGYQNGLASMAKFNSPHGVAYDKKEDKIYVAEASNHTIRVISRTENDAFIVSTLAGIPGMPGYKDGPADSAMFISPHAVIMGPGGVVYTADIGNKNVRQIKNGIVSTAAGKNSTVKNKAEIVFKYVMDIVADESSILLADAGKHQIHRIIPNENVSQITLKDTLSTPHGIAVDGNKNIYIADMGTHRILKIDQTGNVSSIVGTGKAGSGLKELNKPAAVLIHASHLWIADLMNHQIKAIRIED